MPALELLKSRHSVRSYSEKPVSDDVIRHLQAEITMVNTHEAGMHFTLCLDSPEAFAGLKRNYGMFRGVRHYVAAVVETAYPDAYERAGYCAEQIVVKATELDLATCYVGATFDSKSVPVQLRAGWKILFLITFGYPALKSQTFVSAMAMKFAHRHNRSPEQFFEDGDMPFDKAVETFPYLREGLEAVACAPSALNRQPVRISVRQANGVPTVCAHVDKDELLVDLGIAKYNFAFATGKVWEWGNGAPLLT